MTEAKQTVVLVGGPADGRRMKVERYADFIPVDDRPPMPKGVQLDDGPMEETVKRTLYRRRVWGIGANAVVVYAPEDMIDAQVFRAMLEGYKQPVPLLDVLRRRKYLAVNAAGKAAGNHLVIGFDSFDDAAAAADLLPAKP